MRLIDADSLLVNMDKGIQGTAREYLKFFQMAVNDEPTAYDVDKVVKQLENLGWVFANYYPDGTNISRESRKSIPYDRVIEIVKSGGIE